MSVERINVDNKHELEQMISKEIDQLEKNLTVICTQVPINDNTTIDVLCHDENGQLVILQICVNEDDNALLQGVQSLDYVDKFKSFLKMTYNKHKIDDKEKPRLILVAPNFSETLRHTVQHIHGIRIELYEWEYLKIGDHKGLHLQSIFTWKSANSTKSEKTNEKTEAEQEEKPSEKKHEPKQIKKKEPMYPPENKEETKSEPPKPKPEPKPEELRQEPPLNQPPTNGSKEENSFFNTEKEEPQKRKLRLF